MMIGIGLGLTRGGVASVPANAIQTRGGQPITSRSGAFIVTRS